MPKRNLSLADLITDGELNIIRKEYNSPGMTRQEAYARKQAVKDYVNALKGFSFQKRRP